MIKERRLRWLGHAARRPDNNMVEQFLFATRVPGHVQPVGRPCGTCMHYAMRDVKDMGQQMGYRSLEWNWLKEAITYLFGQDFFCYSLYQTLRFLGLDQTKNHLCDTKR